MAQSNHSALGQGLKLYTDGMRRFVKGRLIAAFPNNWWKSGVLDMLPRRQQDSLNYELSKTPNIDKAELIGVGEIEQVVTRHFDHVFKDFPDYKRIRSWLAQVSVARNSWAHPSSGDMSADDVTHDLYTMFQVLKAVKLPEAEAVEALYKEVLDAGQPKAAQATSEAAVKPDDSSPEAKPSPVAPCAETKRITRVTIRKRWLDKGLCLEFPVRGIYCRIPHDTLVQIVSEETPWLESMSWRDAGWYSSASPSKALVKRLQPFELKAPPPSETEKAEEKSNVVSDAAWPKAPVPLPPGIKIERIPEPLDHKPDEPISTDATHTEIQWLLLKLGSDMGRDVWVASNDRGKSFEDKPFIDIPKLRDSLPLGFDPGTTRTIELIDVLWVQGSNILAAFEIEHTTSVYSGLLRFSDLLALQPNLNVPLYIVAPDNRRKKVVAEVNRPTFDSLPTPLRKVCRFIPYGKLRKGIPQEHSVVRNLNPSFIEELSEPCTKADN